jgi:hypothetical protein
MSFAIYLTCIRKELSPETGGIVPIERAAFDRIFGPFVDYIEPTYRHVFSRTAALRR